MESELIAKTILDKLISFAVRGTEIEKVIDKEDDHCFEHVKNVITSLLETRFISYDMDDTDNTQSLSPISFNGGPNSDELNTWEVIPEPGLQKIDRFCPYSISNITDLEYNKIVDAQGCEETEQIEKPKRFSIIRNTVLRRSTVTTVGAGEKKRKTVLLELPSYPITTIKENESEEIKALRKEIEEELRLARITKAEQQKKVEEEEQKQEEKKKKFPFNKMTFGPNGEIIPIKKLKPNAFPKIFLPTKGGVKSITQENSLESPPDSAGNKSKKKRRASVKEEEVIHNQNEEIFPTAISLHKTKDEKGKVIDLLPPSGNNFDLILPQIGVTVKEGEKVKGGNKDFDVLFKKTTLSQYEDYLTKYIPKLNQNRTTELNVDFSNSLNEDNVQLVSEESHHNPLLTEGTENENNISDHYYMNRKKNVSSSAFNSFLNTSRFNGSNLDNSIKLNNKLLSSMHSLKVSLDSIDDLDRIGKSFNQERLKRQINIFKDQQKLKRKYHINVSYDEPMINKFVSSVVTSKNWGEAGFSKSKLQTEESFQPRKHKKLYIHGFRTKGPFSKNSIS